MKKGELHGLVPVEGGRHLKLAPVCKAVLPLQLGHEVSDPLLVRLIQEGGVGEAGGVALPQMGEVPLQEGEEGLLGRGLQEEDAGGDVGRVMLARGDDHGLEAFPAVRDVGQDGGDGDLGDDACAPQRPQGVQSQLRRWGAILQDAGQSAIEGGYGEVDL